MSAFLYKKNSNLEIAILSPNNILGYWSNILSEKNAKFCIILTPWIYLAGKNIQFGQIVAIWN